jgi:hypothetical protein
MDEIGWHGWSSLTDENFTNMDDKLMNQNESISGCVSEARITATLSFTNLPTKLQAYFQTPIWRQTLANVNELPWHSED